MKAKHIPLLATLALAAAFAACNHPVVNVTLPQAAENQSHIYTLFVNARINKANLVPGTLKAFITIEGEEHEMSAAPYGDQIFQYDYAMPANYSLAKYFFTVRYDELVTGLVKHRQIDPDASQIYTLNIVNRYVLEMESVRGPVGAVVAVVGRGFNPADHIMIGGTWAPTTVASSNALTFAVPPLAPGDYPVEWHAGSEVFQIGAFHVDASNLTATPASIEVAATANATLTISMEQLAPQGGIPFEVLTDVPQSVIMPKEIVIPGGQRSATVTITGGSPGSGSLHISAPGFYRAVTTIKVNEAPPAPAPVVAPVAAPVEAAPAPAAPTATPATPETPPAKLPAAAVMGS